MKKNIIKLIISIPILSIILFTSCGKIKNNSQKNNSQEETIIDPNNAENENNIKK